MTTLNRKKFYHDSRLKNKTTSSILEFLSTVMISATTAKFVARDKFILGTGRRDKIKFLYFNDSFIDWFIDEGGKIEGPMTETRLNRYTLDVHIFGMPNGADGAEIIKELGGEANVETTLSAICDLLTKQGNGEEGILHSDYCHRENIFFVRDVDGVLRQIAVHWVKAGFIKGGWSIDALSIDNPHKWYSDRRIFSPTFLAQA